MARAPPMSNDVLNFAKALFDNENNSTVNNETASRGYSRLEGVESFEERLANLPFPRCLPQNIPIDMETQSDNNSSTSTSTPAADIWEISISQRPPSFCQTEKCWKEVENYKNEINELKSQLDAKEEAIKKFDENAKVLKKQTEEAIGTAAERYKAAKENQEVACLYWKIACSLAKDKQVTPSDLAALQADLIQDTTDKIDLSQSDYKALLFFTAHQHHLFKNRSALEDEVQADAEDEVFNHEAETSEFLAYLEDEKTSGERESAKIINEALSEDEEMGMFIPSMSCSESDPESYNDPLLSQSSEREDSDRPPSSLFFETDSLDLPYLEKAGIPRCISPGFREYLANIGKSDDESIDTLTDIQLDNFEGPSSVTSQVEQCENIKELDTISHDALSEEDPMTKFIAPGQAKPSNTCSSNSVSVSQFVHLKEVTPTFDEIDLDDEQGENVEFDRSIRERNCKDSKTCCRSC